MSTQVDERVVAMKFDRKDFGKNVEQTMRELEELDKKLQLKDASKGFEEIEKAASKVSLSGLEKSAEAVEVKFSTMSIVAITAIERIVDSAIDAGGKLVKSMSIDQVTAGFSKYEAKINAVQATLNATRDQGKTLEDVNAVLEKLSWYTDETSYHFDNMSNALSQFIASGQSLEDAGELVMGIANACGLAGVDATKAEHAMTGFVKAIGQGYISNGIWQNQLKTSGITNLKEFRQILIDTAVEVGTLSDAGNGLYKTLKGNDVTVGDINSNMADMWLNTDVMTLAFKRFGKFSSDAFDLCEAESIEASKAIERLAGSTYEFSEAGFKAAQETKTFTDAIGAVQEAVSQRWSKTFELILGNEAEAIEMWGVVVEELLEVFTAGVDKRNKILGEWRSLDPENDGRLVLFQAIGNVWTNLKNIAEALSVAMGKLFPPITGKTLLELTIKFRDFTESIMLSNEALYSLGVIMKVVLLPIRVGFELLKVGFSITAAFVQIIFKLVEAFLYLLATGNPIEDFFRNVFGDERYARVAAALAIFVNNLTVAFSDLLMVVTGFISQERNIGKLIEDVSIIGKIFGTIADILLNMVVFAFESLAKVDFSWIPNIAKNFADFFNRIDAGTLVIIGLTAAIVGLGIVGGVFLYALSDGLWALNDAIIDLAGGGAWRINAIVKLAAALAIISVAVSSMNTNDILTKIIAFAAISAILVATSKVLAVGESYSGKGTTFLLAFSIAVKLLIGALNSIETNDLLSKTGILLGVIGSLVAVMKMLSSETKLIVAGSGFILAFSLAVNNLVGAFNRIDVANLLAKGTVLLTLIGVLAGISKLMASETKMMTAGSMFLLAFSTSINILVGALNKINTSDLLIKGIALLALIGTLSAVNKIMASETKVVVKGASFILAFSVSISILAGALNKIDTTDLLIRGVALLALMGTLVAINKLMSSQTKTVVKGSMFIIAFSSAINILVGALNKINISDILVRGIAILTLIGVLATINKIMASETKNVAKGSAFLLAFSIAISILAGALNKLNVDDLLIRGAGLLSLIGVLAAVNKLLATDTKTVAKGSAFLLAFSLAVNILIGALNKVDTSNLLAKSLILLTIIGILAIINKKLASESGAVAKGSAFILAFSLAVGVLVNAFNRIDPDGILEKIASLFAIVGSLTVAMLAMKNLGSIDLKSTLTSLVTVSVLMWELVAIFAIMGHMDAASNVANATALSLSLLALSAVMKIITTTTASFKDILKGIGSFSLIIVSLGILLTAIGALLTIGEVKTFISNGADFLTMLGVLSPAILLMTLCGGAFALLSVVGAGAIAGVAVFVAMLGIIGTALGIAGKLMSDPNIKSFVNGGVDFFNKVGEAIGGFFGSIVKGVVSKASDSLPILGNNLSTFMNNIQGFLTGINGIDSDKLTTITDFATAIRNIAGIYIEEGSLANFGTELSNFAPSFKEFCNELGTIDNIDTVEASANAAKTMSEFAKNLPSENGKLQDFLGNKNMEEFGKQLVEFGKYFREYYDKITDGPGMDYDVVIASSNAAQSLAEFAKSMPSSNGKLQDFLGSKDMGIFGDQLVKFGLAFRDYYDVITNGNGINYDVVEASSNAAMSIAEFAKSLPANDGVLQDFLGSKDMGVFGNQLTQFGSAFRSYYDVITEGNGIDSDVITASANAASALSELADNIPSTGGWLQKLMGTNDLGEFGETLKGLGVGIKMYSDEVKDILPNKVTSSASAISSLVDIANKLGKTGGLSGIFGTQNLSDFGNQLESFGSSLGRYGENIRDVNWNNIISSVSNIRSFIDVLKDVNNVNIFSVENFKTSLEKLASTGVSSFTNTFYNSEKVVSDIGNFLTKTVSDSVDKKQKEIENIGANIVKGISKGITSNLQPIENASETLTSTLVGRVKSLLGIQSPSKKFIQVSKFCILGLEKGFLENQNIANNAASNVAENFLQAMKDTLEIHSPSYRVRQEVARPILEAFPEEFDENNQAEQAAKAKGEAIMTAFKSAFSDSNEARELMELERELFELKLDPAFTDEQKQKALNEFDTEQQKKILETYVDDYKLAVQQYQTIVKEMGEESSYAKEAQKTMLQQEITLRKYATQLTEATNAQVQAEMESYQSTFQELIQFMDTDYVSNQVKNQLKSMAKEGTLIDGLGIDEQLDQLEKDIASGSYEKKYASIVSSIKQGIWKEMSADTVVGGKMTQAVTADDIVKDLLGGVSIDEYAMQDVAGDLADSFVNAYLEELKKKSASTSSDVASALTGSYDFSNVGTALNEDFMAQIKNSIIGGDDDDDSIFSGTGIMRTISDTVDNITGWLSNSGDWATSAIDSGKNFVSGLIEGLTDKEQEEKVKRTSKHVGDITTAYLDDGLGNASPSKFARESGMYFVQGLANGLDDYSYISTNAAEELARKVVSALSGYTDATESIAPVLVSQSEYNLSPVITPTLDLTEVEKGVSQIDAMLSALEARAIAFSMNPTVEENQNRSINPAKSGGTSITFNQYNSSPKALSETEIYRQTKNQLTALKERGSYK